MPALVRQIAVSAMETDHWASLVAAVEQLSAAECIEDIIRIVRDTARAISGADGVTFVLRDGTLCHYVEENAIGPLWKGRRFPMSACISGWCMLNRKIAVIPDIYLDPRIPHDAYRQTFVKSLIMVPVRVDDPIAAIGSYWRERRDFSDEEIALLDGLGRSTAAAIVAVQSRARLREKEQRLRMALEAGKLGAWELRFATGEFEASSACKAHFGCPADSSFSFRDFMRTVHADDVGRVEKAFEEALQAGSDLHGEFRVVWPDNDVRWIELRGRVVTAESPAVSRMMGVSTDMTERRRARDRIEHLQSELAHSGRQNELGQMSSAFAHELAQPLAAAHNYLGVAQRLLQADSKEADRLQDIVGKADAQFVRASKIIRRIRDFSRKGHATRSPEDVATLIDEAVEIALINPNHRDARLILDLPPDRLIAVVDKVQIQQVLLNLLRNGFEAMEGMDDRTIRVSAAPAGEGTMIELRVEDNGPGLSQEVAARLFQPFVTSKRDGMGVGLSLSRQIVESHGGNMWVDPEYDRGAAFCFTVLAEPRT